MGDITWKYVKPLKNLEVIKEFEARHQIKIPKALIECISENNGGRPVPNIFDTDGRKERVFKTLLSFNQEDKENIYHAEHLLKNDGEIKLVPFASDPFGNYICINIEGNDAVIFLHHETGRVENVAQSFEEFLSMLYE